MEQLKDYQLDETNYDYIVLGFGLTEQILSASLQNKHKILNIDLDDIYSSSLKTYNLKELIAFIKDENEKTIKKEIYINKKQKKAVENLDLYRKFNIDLQPRLIYSSSLTTDILCSTNIDNYLEFNDIKQIQHYDFEKQKFLDTSCTKSDIFKHKDLSLLEKRTIFKLLQTFVQLVYKQNEIEKNQNSLNDYDKDIELQNEDQKLYEQFKDKNCVEYFQQLKTSYKIQEIFIYSIANYEFNHLNKELSTEQLFKRIFKFIKSMGIHSTYPFLYTNYGTSNINQTFSRISAFQGGTFILNPKIQIADFSFQNQVKFQSNMNKDKLTCKKLIIGQEYYDYFQKDKQDQYQYLYREIIIIKNDQEIQCPKIYNIPAKDKLNPVQILILSDSSSTTPKDHYAIQIKCVMDQLEDEEIISNHIKDIIQKEFQNEIYYNCSYVQVQKQTFHINDYIQVIKYDDFGIDLDEMFQNAKKIKMELTNESEMFQLKNKQEDDDDFDDLVNKISQYKLN